MRPILLALAILTAAVFESGAFAQDCICPKVALYPVPGGWLHYSMVCDIQPGGCNELYLTSSVHSTPMTGRTCVNSNDCGTCVDTYSTMSNSSRPNLYFANSLPYSDLDDADAFRLFLKSIGGNVYDSKYVFREPRVLQLQRPAGSFYAIVYEVEYTAENGDTAVAYTGVELGDTTAPVSDPIVVDIQNRHNAVATRRVTGGVRHTRVDGLLQVSYADGTEQHTAHIRLHNSNANKNANYPPFKTNVVYYESGSNGSCYSSCEPLRGYGRCRPYVRWRRCR